MGAFGGICLLFGLFFLYKAFTAQNLFGGGFRKRLNVFGENAGKIDCGLLAAVMLFAAFEFFWNM